MMTNRAIPKLRFKGFKNRWDKNYIGSLIKVSSSKRIHQSEWTKKGIPFLRARDIVAKIQGLKVNNPLCISKKTYLNYSKISGTPSIGDLLVTGVGTIGKPLLIKSSKPFYFKDGNIVWFHNDILDKYFFYYYFLTNAFKKYIKATTNVGTVPTYTITSGRHTPITYPTLSEQQHIGNFFATLDKLIQLQQKKVALLKKLKKAYLQKMFPRKDEDVPRLRFKGFHGKWRQSTFKSILNYEQPTKYRVENTHYSSSGVPVLTANKTFILGYTHEKRIYNKGNCIIFDDFTLDNKFVDFPFMIKSSAIKILTSRNSNLYFDYELLNVVHLIHEGHKRHYISMVQNFKILIPSLYEQNKIGNFFHSVNIHINLQRNKLIHLRKLKKAYLQKMFC